jgi:D-alanine-D-alanine ligase
MRDKRVGVLMGGFSAEKAISIQTGEAVVAALRELRYDVQPIFVDRDVDLVLRQAQIDVAFVALHGRYGEDGCIQGLLETLGIPYTGSDVLSSALAMHKVRAKELFRLRNLPTPAYYVLTADDEVDIAAQHGEFGFPVVVKPVGEGSSVGVELARDLGELAAAAERALCFDDEVLVERFVPGREVSVAVLGDRALGAVEIVPPHGVYDYAAKYTAGACAYHAPPRLGPERHRGVLAQALLAHRALGCSGATRVDLIVSEGGNEQVLEVNTVPGLTPTSLLPRIAAAAGIAFPELCDIILRGARLAALGRGRADRRLGRRPFRGPDRREAGATSQH